ncbi:hypothetical protein EAG_15521 [Camponotus floridanus]|uniref:Uncharacterized protein n=1 Tax=Camponotus floridanus TaxID=104421 RepID=E2AZJ9_CAMFO|nr:hypothetical protein EAG_15521 [Camponotus floridanus]
MIDLEHDISKFGEENRITLQEYRDMYKEIKEDLNFCNTNQDDIRSKLEALYIESKNSSNAMRDYISGIHLEECCNKDVQVITNLKEQIATLRTEKDSALQMVQVLWKTVDELQSEQKLRIDQINCKDVKLYEEQLEIVKQQYSEVIKALENKLLKIKDDFAKQQSQWITSKETIEILKREKQEIENNLQDFQRTVQQKDKNNQHIIQSLTEELSTAKAEIQRLNNLNSNSERKLNESKKVVNNIMTKNEEIKCKMAEALDLIEYAIKEKDVVLEREAKVVEQNNKLEAQLISITKEHTIKMQEEIAKLKDAHEHDVKKYLLEIKELRSKLQENVMLLDRSQRENKLLEIEMEKMQQSTANLLEKSAAKILQNVNFDQTSKYVDSKTCNETCKLHSLEMQQLQEKISNLEENLIISNNKLKQIQQQNPMNLQDCIKLSEEGMRDVIDRYNHLESQLIKATTDKESLTTKLKSLQSAFDCEISKRDNERCTLENKIRELEMNLEKEKNTRENKSGTSICPVQVSSQHCTDTISKHTLDIRIKNMDHKWDLLLAEKKKDQQDFDKKLEEMKYHLKVHQELNKR